MNGNLPKFAMVMTSDDQDVKRSTKELRDELAATSQAATQTAPAFEAQAAAINTVATASRNLTRATEETATAARRNIASIGAAADAVRPSMDRLINSFAGITAPAANRNGRAADIAFYGQEMDRLRAKFDPLFAAQQRHQSKIEEINQAEKVGALTASQAIDIRIRETNAINALVNNLDRLGMARKAAAEGAVQGVTVTPNRGADITAFLDQRDQTRAKFDPVFAVLTRYKQSIEEIREANRTGILSEQKMAEAISQRRQAALAAVGAIKGRGPSEGGGQDREGQFRRQNLMYQGFDIGQGLFGGMPIGMIAAQQLPQIAQNYVGQGGGTAGFMKDLTTMAGGALRAITPLTAGIAGLTAGVAVGAIAYSGYLTSTKEVETAASGLGRAVAGSSAEMEAAAQAGAAAAGISVASARSMEAQFLRTGRIGSDNFEQLIGLSKDFGATVGLDADAAGAALADMFADPAKAAETLYRQYGLIDAATAKQVTNLARQNRETEAQALLISALPNQLSDASEATTALGRAWDYATTKASNFFDSVGQGIDGFLSGPSPEERIAELQESISRRPRPGQRGRRNGDADQRELDRLLEERRQREAEEAERNRRAEDIARSRAVTSLIDGSGAGTNTRRVQTLRNEIQTLESGQGLSGVNQEALLATLESKRRVLDAVVNYQARGAELDRLDIQIQNERNPLLRAELEARRARLQLAEQEISSDEAGAAAARARNRVIEETIAGARSQAQDLKNEFDIRSELNGKVASGAITSADANRMLQEELTLRPLIAAAATAEIGAKGELQKIINDMKSGYAGLAEQERRAGGQEYLRSQNERIEQLRVEQALIGSSDEVRERSIALLKVEQEIRQRGLDTNGGLAKQMRDQADAAAKLNSQIERQADAWNNVKSASEDAISGAVDSLLEGDFTGALDAVKEALTGFVKDDIKANLGNALLGTDKGTSADIGGIPGIFNRLLGGGKADPASIVSKAMGQSVAAMTVSAGTVVVNGGVAGSVGSLLGGANDNKSGGYSGLAGAGSPLSFVGNYKPGVDTRLTDILNTASQQFPGYKVDAMSGLRPGDPRFHGKGLATDVQLTELATGKRLGNYQDASSFADYEKFAQVAKQVQMEKYPELADKFRWGGYFGGGKGKYGAVDQMHFDLGGAGMGGGSWEKGMTSAQMNLWPGIESKGMAAVESLGNLATTTNATTQGLGTFGNGLGQIGSALGQAGSGAAGGGGGLFGWLGNLFGGGVSPTSSSWAPNTTLSSVIGLAGGGPIVGPGGPRDDAIPIMASNGEFMVNAEATAKNRPLLEAINSNKPIGRRADGGYISSISTPVPGHSNAGGGSFSRDDRPVLQIVNNSSTPITGEVEEAGSDERGRRQYRLVMNDAVADAVSVPGGKADKTMQRRYRMRRAGVDRG